MAGAPINLNRTGEGLNTHSRATFSGNECTFFSQCYSVYALNVMSHPKYFRICSARFEVLMAVLIKTEIFWDMNSIDWYTNAYVAEKLAVSTFRVQGIQQKGTEKTT